VFPKIDLGERAKVTFGHLTHTNPLLDPSSRAHQEVLDRGFRVAVDGETFAL
jgi:hypothetical protein